MLRFFRLLNFPILRTTLASFLRNKITKERQRDSVTKINSNSSRLEVSLFHLRRRLKIKAFLCGDVLSHVRSKWCSDDDLTSEREIFSLSPIRKFTSLTIFMSVESRISLFLNKILSQQKWQKTKNSRKRHKHMCRMPRYFSVQFYAVKATPSVRTHKKISHTHGTFFLF